MKFKKGTRLEYKFVMENKLQFATTPVFFDKDALQQKIDMLEKDVAVEEVVMQEVKIWKR